MKRLYFLLFIISTLSCNIADNDIIESEENIFPLKITMYGTLGGFKQLRILGHPEITFHLKEHEYTVTMGEAESYEMKYHPTGIRTILDKFDPADFKQNGSAYMSYQGELARMTLESKFGEEEFLRKIVNIKGRPIDGIIPDLNQNKIPHFTALFDQLNQISRDLFSNNIPIISSENGASSMTEALKDPEKIYYLKLRNNKKVKSIEGIGQLKNLRILDISGTKIQEIPDEIINCHKLITLIGNASPIQKIPDEIGKLNELRLINLSSCKLKSIPESIGNLHKLWSLSLGSNQITSLPKSIGQLKDLTFFSIADNGLTAFPEEILNFKGATNLWLHNNSFNSVPEGIANMEGIFSLFIDYEEIENMDRVVELLPNVSIISDGDKRLK